MKKLITILLLIMLSLFFSCKKHQIKQPKDFDLFWSEAIKELKTVAPSAKIEKDSLVNGKNWSLHKINSYNNIYFYAWVSEPIVSGKFPIKIRFSGMSKANTNKNHIPNYWFLKEDKTINMLVDIRGQGLSTEQIKYTNYLTNGLENQNKYIYKGAYLDAVRAIEYISENPKSNGNIIATGSGQGGAIAIAATALNPKVTICSVGFPFFSDIANYNKKEWPMKSLMFYCIKQEINYFDLIDRLSYFDMISFADMIKVPIFIKSQKIDNITPINGILKFFNKINIEEKKIHVDSCKGHGCVTNSINAIKKEKAFIKANMHSD